jgi:hypothetical protein
MTATDGDATSGAVELPDLVGACRYAGCQHLAVSSEPDPEGFGSVRFLASDTSADRLQHGSQLVEIDADKPWPHPIASDPAVSDPPSDCFCTDTCKVGGIAQTVEPLTGLVFVHQGTLRFLSGPALLSDSPYPRRATTYE